jgi:4-alpha-glucanotransferase
MLQQRSSGILMHVTSLASPYGMGDLGATAYAFADFLQRAGQSAWQVLPLNYTTVARGSSPYNSISAFAMDPMLISIERLYQEGLLTRADLREPPRFPPDQIDFAKVQSYRSPLLDVAFERFDRRPHPPDYETFCRDQAAWLEPFSLFAALRRRFRKRSWCDWPRVQRDCGWRIADCGLDKAGGANHQSAIINARFVERERFLQYVVYRQYERLKRYAWEKGIQIIGDVPIYVTHDSADVWSHRDLFQLDRSGRAKLVSGVPPDYFSKTGQLWGNPVYDWDALRRTGFEWWMQRLEHNLRLFDMVRIDHFRGLVAYWQIPARHKNAMRGTWVEAPSEAFFTTLFRRLPSAAVFAEDLGHITADVREVVTRYHLPCMRVMQFAFDGDPAHNPHMPHNHIANAIVYSGTHDNNTARGWFEDDMDEPRRRRFFDYIGRRVKPAEVPWELMRLAMASVGRLAIVPMQDLLGLRAQARMNHPARTKGNWRWRMRGGLLGPRLADRLRHLTEVHGRL